MANKPIDCDQATRYAASRARHRRRSSSRDPSVSRDLKEPVLPGGSNKLKAPLWRSIMGPGDNLTGFLERLLLADSCCWDESSE